MATILLNRAGIRGALPPDHPEYQRLGITKSDHSEDAAALAKAKAMAAVADPDEAFEEIEADIHSRAADAMRPGEGIAKAEARVLEASPELYDAYVTAHRRRCAKANGEPY
jgi:hypothetical protein